VRGLERGDRTEKQAASTPPEGTSKRINSSQSSQSFFLNKILIPFD
jgi:hypothetical protein